MHVQNTWRRAGAKYWAAGRLVVMTVVAALLAAAAVLPAIGIFGVAARDAANTFDTLSVGTLGTAPSRSVIYDSQGHVITYLYPNNIYRVPVSFNQIAPVMRNAIVAIEDASSTARVLLTRAARCEPCCTTQAAAGCRAHQRWRSST